MNGEPVELRLTAEENAYDRDIAGFRPCIPDSSKQANKSNEQKRVNDVIECSSLSTSCLTTSLCNQVLSVSIPLLMSSCATKLLHIEA